MTTPYIDPNLIFAENAPAHDKPSAFQNYDKGWDASRSNNGRPLIPQMNYLTQQADLKNLYIHENGAALPYKEGVAYEENAVVVKDGELVQYKGGEFVPLNPNGIKREIGNISNISIFSLTESGYYYISNATDFPEGFGRVVGLLNITKFGGNTIYELKDRYDLTKTYTSINKSDWQLNSSNNLIFKSNGILDGVDVKTVTGSGTYLVINATNLPPDYKRNNGILFVYDFAGRKYREIVDQYDVTVRFAQVSTGDWVELKTTGEGGGGGAIIDIDPNTLATGDCATDLNSETDVFYKDGTTLSVRQSKYEELYKISNNVVASKSSSILQFTYDYYDQLVSEFPEFMSMNILGYDDTGLEIREYILLPHNIGKMASAPSSINKFKEIMIMSGQHGMEATAIVNGMLFCSELLRNPNGSQLLKTIRTSFKLRIMPCMCPWGVKNRKRRNSNGVDLNRNFPNGWENAAGDKGPSPLSEKESQVFVKWIEDNKSNALCLINMHDHSDAALTWGTATLDYGEGVIFRAFQDYAAWYLSSFTNPTPEVNISWIGNPRDGYSDRYVGYDLGLPTVLFECPYINHPKLPDSWIYVRLASLNIMYSIMGVILEKYKSDF